MRLIIDHFHWQAHTGVAAGFALVMSFEPFCKVRGYAYIERFICAF